MFIGNVINILMVILGIIFVIACSGSMLYYWRKRITKVDIIDDENILLRYFVQPQFNNFGDLIGYECLIREKNDKNEWKLPIDFNHLSLKKSIILLEDILDKLPNNAVNISINLQYSQLISANFRYFIRWAIAKVSTRNLIIECSVDELVKNIKLERNIKLGKEYGMQLAINNLNSSYGSLAKIEWLLPEIDILKVSIKYFKKANEDDWLDLNLGFWTKFAKQKNIRLILVGIETAEDKDLAEKLRINLRQGYFFGKPIDVYDLNNI
ncbi:EAL domain-containing protein (putative c-di-GMP-specific phosphodiesterase class I) [Weissella beninensis]|uniref:EAL domain-containing protein n=1 Tax=Periweissella beninensis TaxID=504936 RepID=UPI00196121DE|nr:EAL domain-containing protein [Periweissella beninensis]MBM7543771.1 EAL domain-containing protein (putative c-di-GMP-specific phosphodiesterase class I) [Periweissella beninensis]